MKEGTSPLQSLCLLQGF